MKLKKVVALCLSRGRVQLYDQVDENGEVTQWLGDGCAIYPLGGIPYLDEDTFCAVFDIPEKKREKLMIFKDGMPENISVKDYIAGDKNAEKMDISISYDGTTVVPFQLRPEEDGIVYIQEKYLAPLADVADDLQFCERVDAKDQKYIVALVGLLIAAVIMPFDVGTGNFWTTMKKLVHLAPKEVDHEKPKE